MQMEVVMRRGRRRGKGEEERDDTKPLLSGWDKKGQ